MEFVLVVPLLITLFFLIFEFGRVFGSWVLVTNASREGARYGLSQAWSAHQCGGAGGTGSCTTNDYNIQLRAAQTARFLSIQNAGSSSGACNSSNQPPSGATSCVAICEDTFTNTTCDSATDTSGDHRISVLVVYQVQTLMPITANIPYVGTINYPGYMTISGQAIMRTEQ